VRPEQLFLGGDPEQPRGARVALFVHVVAQPGDEASGGALRLHRVEGEGVPAVVVVGQGAVSAGIGEDGVQESTAVFGDAEEP
jgi:hypothetical protein